MPEEIKPEVISKTQKSLGKFIKKPPLSEKLLKKPPFRFLHDIVNAVIKETGFFAGLFTSAELNSENVKERDAKIAFLAKLIDATKIITKTDLAVRPSKIVAGLEPTETNLLLQAIGAAIDKKLDSSEYVKQLQSGDIPKVKPKKTKPSEKDKKSTENKAQTKPKEKVKTPIETPKSTDRNKRATKPTTKTPEDAKKTTSKDKPKKKKTTNKDPEEKEPQAEAEIIETATKKETETVEEAPPSIQDPEIPKNEEPLLQETPEAPLLLPENEPKKRIPSASRPKSARPRSGEQKPAAPISDSAKTALSSSTLRPPSVRPSSARPGAPRLRPDSGIPTKEVIPMGKINVIVENFDKDLDEEEETTVVIQSSHAEEDDSPTNNNENVLNEIEASSGNNKGHLVEQILEQINEGDGDKVRAKKVEIDWQKDLEGKGSVSKETANLRNLIQNLTKTANPFGKLLNYLHEDIDAMHAELAQWRNTKKQLFAEIAKQKKITHEMNKPLVNQLENLNQEIKKYESEIVSTRSNILRNETKIKELLVK